MQIVTVCIVFMGDQGSVCQTLEKRVRDGRGRERGPERKQASESRASSPATLSSATLWKRVGACMLAPAAFAALSLVMQCTHCAQRVATQVCCVTVVDVWRVQTEPLTITTRLLSHATHACYLRAYIGGAMAMFTSTPQGAPTRSHSEIHC